MRVRALTPDAIASAAEMIRVLGHPVRLRIVEALERGECCVSELQDALGISQAVMSQQLARMRAAGILRGRRDGVNVRYEVADPRVLLLLNCLRHAPDAAPRRTTRSRKRS